MVGVARLMASAAPLAVRSALLIHSRKEVFVLIKNVSDQRDPLFTRTLLSKSHYRKRHESAWGKKQGKGKIRREIVESGFPAFAP